MAAQVALQGDSRACHTANEQVFVVLRVPGCLEGHDVTQATPRRGASHAAAQATLWRKPRRGASFAVAQATLWCKPRRGASHAVAQATLWRKPRRGASHAVAQATCMGER